MPTYNCFISPGKLTPAQKQEIAHVCTDVYHEADQELDAAVRGKPGKELFAVVRPSAFLWS
jgi:hypothetical protein